MTAPLVTIVTPFYNTAAYLRQCIESVLAQTYGAWEYVLVDNWSTDGSADIAREYTGRDARLRVVRTPRHLSQLENYNFGLGLGGEGSAYLKMVQADDWILPECVARMVDVAERYPTVGLVSSYHVMGSEVLAAGLPPERECFSGREICRAQLLDGRFFLGSPTAVLYRASVMRERTPFYDVEALHADTEVGYRILASRDFGFIHQVLTYLRVEDESISGQVRDWNPHLLDKLIVLKKYGPEFLSPAEYEATLADVSRRYWRYVGRCALRRRPAEFWAYHARGLGRIGERLTRNRLVGAVAAALLDLVLHPKETLSDVRQLLARSAPHATKGP